MTCPITQLATPTRGRSGCDHKTLWNRNRSKHMRCHLAAPRDNSLRPEKPLKRHRFLPPAPLYDVLYQLSIRMYDVKPRWSAYRRKASHRLGTAASRLPTCTHPLISSAGARRPGEYRRKDNYRRAGVGPETDEELRSMTLLGMSRNVTRWRISSVLAEQWWSDAHVIMLIIVSIFFSSN